MQKVKTLQSITNELNNEDITWGLGGSLLLYFHGITNTFNDIDILIMEEDALKADILLSKIAKKQLAVKKEPFNTKHFYKYKTDEISIDVMGGFGITHSEGTYWLDFNEKSVVGVGEGEVPLSSIEDWYILYQLIPGKEEKVRIIEDYWKKQTIQNPEILKKALSNLIPKRVALNISQVLKLQSKFK